MNPLGEAEISKVGSQQRGAWSRTPSGILWWHSGQTVLETVRLYSHCVVSPCSRPSQSLFLSFLLFLFLKICLLILEKEEGGERGRTMNVRKYHQLVASQFVPSPGIEPLS